MVMKALKELEMLHNKHMKRKEDSTKIIEITRQSEESANLIPKHQQDIPINGWY